MIASNDSILEKHQWLVLLAWGLAAALGAFAWLPCLPGAWQTWALAGMLFFALKALLMLKAEKGSLGFLLLWPGMDVTGFERRCLPDGRARDWVVRGATCLALGFGLMAVGHQMVDRFLGTWVAMVGLILALHCGVFALLAAAWRTAGRDVVPIMQAPLLACSVTDFWGGRWNRAFSDAATVLVLKPSGRRIGVRAATFLVFLLSGLAHELVISVPAGAGHGGPTAYFVLQGVAVVWERGCPLRARWLWRLRAWAVLILPLPLLFPRPFVMQVMRPLFDQLFALLPL